MHSAHLLNSNFPASWFTKVRKFTVRDEINPDAAIAWTVVTIYYPSEVSASRKLTFTENGIAHESVESYRRPAQAQALVERLKEAIGYPASPKNVDEEAPGEALDYHEAAGKSRRVIRQVSYDSIAQGSPVPDKSD